MMDEATAAELRDLVAKGVFACGVLETDDCQGTYETLKKLGVEFKTPPVQRPYGMRISLTYDDPTNAGKTSAHTDTYHGRFVKLVPGDQVVWVRSRA